MKGFLKVLAVLLALPLLCLAGLAAFAHLAQPVPGGDGLSCTVDQPVVWPGQRPVVSLNLDFKQPSTAKPAPVVTDVLLLVDCSGSMEGPSLAQAKAAAASFASVLIGPDFRVGVVAFESTPSEVAPLSSSIEQAEKALSEISATGGTSIALALEMANTIFAKPSVTGAPARRRAVVVLSDGQDSDSAQMQAQAQRLKDAGVDIFAIGLGQGVNEELLRRLASQPTYFAYTLDPGQLANIYMEFGGSLAETVGHKGELLEQVDTGLFELPPGAAQLLQSRYDPVHGIMQWSLPVIFAKPNRFTYRPVPKLAGLMRPARQPATLTYASFDGQVHTLQTETRPWLLILTWPFLLALFLPALLYILYKLIRLLVRRRPKPVEEVPVVIAPPVHRDPPFLTNLPLPPRPMAQALPTLFLGLGNTGRWGLTHLKHLLHQVWGENIPAAYQLLCLDLARQEYYGDQSLTVKVGSTVLAPNEIALVGGIGGELVAALNRQGQAPPWQSGWQAGQYAGLAYDSLDTDRGSQHRRGLARLPLINDLAQGRSNSVAAQNISAKLDILNTQMIAGQTIQVMVLACPLGGVGSGWFEAVAYVARRLAREILPPATPVSCQGHLILALQGLNDSGGRNLQAFTAELGRLSMAGRRPIPISFGPADRPDPGLDGVLDRPLLDGIHYYRQSTVNQAGPPQAALAQAAECLALLSEQTSAATMARPAGGARVAPSAASGWPAGCVNQIASLRLPVAAMADRVKSRCLRRVFGGGMLLDLAEVAGRTSFRPLHYQDQEGLAELQQWQAEPFIEQQCPALLADFRRHLAGEPVTWADWLAKEAVNPLDVWLPAQARHYGQYLERGLDSLLHAAWSEGMDVHGVRCGRINRAYHLSQFMFQRFGVFQRNLGALSTGLSPELRVRLDELANQYQAVHRELLEEMERWAFGLISPQALAEPLVAERTTFPGFYQSLVAREEELTRHLSDVAPQMDLRRDLIGTEPSPLEQALLDDIAREWLAGEGGLLARLWFEARAAGSDTGRLAPRLRLVLQAETRQEFELDADLPEKLWQSLGGLLDRLCAPLWSGSALLRLLVDPKKQPLDPIAAAQWLARAQPRLDLPAQVIPSRRRLLVQPGDKLLFGLDGAQEYLKAVAGRLDVDIPDVWSRADCPSGDPNLVGVLCQVDQLPLNSVPELDQALHLAKLDQQWHTKLEYLHAVDHDLERYYRRALQGLTGLEVPPLDPSLALLLEPRDRFLLFAQLWAMDCLQKDNQDMQMVYRLRAGNLTMDLACQPDQGPDLFDAALGFKPTAEEARGCRAWLDSFPPAQVDEALARGVDALEAEVKAALAGRNLAGRIENLKMMLWVELAQEQRRRAE
ncbi:MAG: vWA domain-containing protein [Pseudomonadota bacterium]